MQTEAWYKEIFCQLLSTFWQKNKRVWRKEVFVFISKGGHGLQNAECKPVCLLVLSRPCRQDKQQLCCLVLQRVAVGWQTVSVCGPLAWWQLGLLWPLGTARALPGDCRRGWISSSTCGGIFNCPQSSVAHLALRSTQDSSPCSYNMSHGGAAAFQLQTRLHLVELLKTFGLYIQDFAVLSCVLVVCRRDLPRPVLAGSNCSEILKIRISRRGWRKWGFDSCGEKILPGAHWSVLHLFFLSTEIEITPYTQKWKRRF